MARFFDRFPKVSYDIENKQLTNLQAVTNVFFRMQFIREVLKNVSSYYDYLIRDSDTPEILADNVYGDPEAHWIILMANDIVDPQFDWPLNDEQFFNYMVKKYRSTAEAHFGAPNVANVQIISGGTGYTNGYVTFTGGSGSGANASVNTSNGVITNITVNNKGFNYKIDDVVTANVTSLGGTGANLKVNIQTINDIQVISFTQTEAYANSIHHYEKVIQRIDSSTDETTETRLWIDRDALTTNLANSFANTSYFANTAYDNYNNLPTTQSVEVFNFGNGETVTEIIFRDAITYYDYELAANEAKRSIKIIKREYYGQIVDEFNNLTKYNATPYLRKLV